MSYTPATELTLILGIYLANIAYLIYRATSIYGQNISKKSLADFRRNRCLKSMYSLFEK
jgi:hypothetical protein